jgi:ubiquinone/menaquinone biosynthesis C-methylase UbiE
MANTTSSTTVQHAPPKGIVHRAILLAERVAPGLRPRFQTALIRTFYSGLSVVLKSDDAAFLNYGYAPLNDQPMMVNLDPADVPDRYSTQLYLRVAGAINLRDKDVLEVGCGRGGGASFIARYLGPASMTGVDISERAVRFCRRRHPGDRLKFERGEAERLPFASSSFDAVVNVESSHCYPSFSGFVDEVARVLRPTGAFLIADLRPREEIASMRSGLAKRFTIIDEELITPNVVRALELDSDRRTRLIQRRTPKFLHKSLESFASVSGSPMFDAFAAGNLQYVRFVLQKQESGA